MQTRSFSWQALYLRWAGLFSAIMGLASFWALILAYRELDPQPKLLLAIVGFACAFLGYIIGKDIMDRVRNHEASADLVPNRQSRLAFSGTKFGLALIRLILLIALASVVVFSVPVIERIAFLCSDSATLSRCAHNLFGFNFTD